MSLSSALSIAQSALLNTSRQTSVVSRNISEGSNPEYARRSGVLVSSQNGAQVVQIQRTTNEVLFRQNMVALSSAAGQQFLYDGVSALNIDVNGIDNAGSAAKALSDFQLALQTYSSTPSNRSVAENVVENARQLTRTLNNGAVAIQSFRSDMDRQILGAVGELNSLLTDFEQLNKEVVGGTKVGKDVNEALDQRDAVLKKISELIPVSVVKREANDMMLVTDSGATLFETTPREVTFSPIAGYAAGVEGNPIRVDGVAISGGTGGNTSASGRLSAMIQLREEVAGGLQGQLDEVARGLITAFAEVDQTGVQPDAAGLFTWPGAPAIPAAGTLVNGLAGVISINSAFDATQGGNPHLVRDGGANGADYVVNTDGGASFTGQILAYTQKLETPIAFDTAAGIEGTISLVGYAAESLSWFDGIRQDAFRAAESKTALMMRTQETLSNATGVNIDEELTLLLDLEHGYEASARLMRAVDEMLAALLDAVR